MARPHRMPLASRDRRGVPPASGLPWSRVLLMGLSGQCCFSWYGLKMSGFEGTFERNPKIAGGELVLRGTRVPLRSVLASLAEGCSVDEILQAFPTLTREQLRDAVAFAASSALKALPRAASGERELSDASGRLDDDERLEAALEKALGRSDDGGSGAPAEGAASDEDLRHLIAAAASDPISGVRRAAGSLEGSRMSARLEEDRVGRTSSA